MRLKEFIPEARRNLRLNPKIAINRILNDRYNATEDYIADTKNLFVNFTTIDKLGVNPRSRYNTPLGIYSYPARYVLMVTGRYKPMKMLPFAGEHPYINIFSTKGNIIDLNKINDEKLNNYYQKIINLYAKYSNDKTSNQITNIIDQANNEANFNNNGGLLWYVTMMASRLLANIPEWKTFNYPLSWTKLFRSIGIDGCVDLGTGIIHENEPTQAVFFDINAIVDNQRFLNKYSFTTIRQQRELGRFNIQEKQKVNQRIKEILNQSDSENNLTQLFNNDPNCLRYAKLTLIPKQLLFDIFAKNPSYAKYLDQVPEYLQKFLIDQDPTYAAYIKYLAKKLQVDLVEANPSAIRYIQNSTEEAQLAAIQQDPSAIKYIMYPSERIQIQSVKQDPTSVQFINNPSEQTQIMVMSKTPENFYMIKKPTEKIQLIAIKYNFDNIRKISNPSARIITAIKQYFNQVPEHYLLPRIRQHPKFIQYIDNPSEKMKLVAKMASFFNSGD